MSTPTREEMVANDTALADLYSQKFALVAKLLSAIETRSFYDERGNDHYVEEYTQEIQQLHASLKELKSRIEPYEAFWGKHRWSRFFLVRNNNGHIHSSMECSTCFESTQFGWLPSLSGLTEADAVEQEGEILCSVCFPSAPVEWTNGKSKEALAAKTEREAKKAERLAKKREKALVPEDIEGGLVLNINHYSERLTTIAAAKAWLRDAYAWGLDHPSYPPEAVELVATTLAARIGSTVEEVLATAAGKRAKQR